MKALKVAVVGVGHLGRVHARILSKMQGVRLVGVVDVSAQQRDAVAEACRTNAFPDHLAVADKIDAAVIATPTKYHHAVAMDLIRRGIHLLVEKPLAVTPEQGEELVAAARAAGVVLQVGHVERFNPAVTAAGPWLREPKWIEGRRLGGFACRILDVGVVLDLMIHDIDLVLAATGEKPNRVEAAGLALFGQHEDIAQATLRFPGGCVAQLTASRLSYQPERKMQVWSEAGFASLDFATRSATVIRPHEAVYERSLDAAQLSPEMRDELREHMFDKYLVKETITPEPADQITAELEDFATAIRTSSKPRVDGAAGLAALDVAQQVLAAMERHAWDGERGHRFGPKVQPLPHVLPGPHFLRRAAQLADAELSDAADQRD